MKLSTAFSNVATCSSSLLPKGPWRPPLLIETSSARRPIVSPSSPSIDARRSAVSSTSTRVSATAAAVRRGISGSMLTYERSVGKSLGDAGGCEMQARWLGWAGVELEEDGVTLVIDPLADPAGVFAALAGDAREVELPPVAPATAGRAVGGLVSHLHRDHTDAGALARALAAGAAVHHPAPTEDGNLALAQAEYELGAAELPREAVATWDSVELGPFTCTALPAVDGLGDPQVSWLVEARGRRVLHLGDTAFHGAWWQMSRRAGPCDVVFAPVNGAVVDFPHQQPPSPLPAAMEPAQAALAGQPLGAATVVPMHYGGFALEPHYRPIADARERFEHAARDRPYRAAPLAPGAAL